MENGHAPRQRRTLREILSSLVRTGHIEVWRITDRELTDATRPNITTEKIGETMQEGRTFKGFKLTWPF